ncbi:MAG: translocation/assembly module TamB domain-containing protein [Pseudomonadota bacterium]
MRVLRFFRFGLFGLVGLLLLALALLAGAWFWGGSATSLSTVMSRVASYLPAGQSLEVGGVTGSLRYGGHIGMLRWRMGELRVEAQNVEVGWTLPPLWDRELRFSHLRIGQLRIDDRRAPTPPKDSQAPADLGLPMRVSVHFVIDSVQWQGPPALVATGLTGSYNFDNKQHSMDVGQVHIASGTYALQARLQSTAPMALVATLDGWVEAPVPRSGKRVMLKTLARLEGDMAPANATLALHARLRSDTAGQQIHSPKATVDAQLQPWKAQPLAQAQVLWEALDLAALWPQAPLTLLSGNASVTPAGATWRATVAATNAASGPWNTHALPLQSLQAEVVFDQGSWLLQTLRAQGAGGELLAHGEADPAADRGVATSAWKLTASARHINPHAVDTRLDADTLNGELTAAQTPAGIRFDAKLQGASPQSPQGPQKTQGLRLQTAQARGLWRAPTLQLDSLLLQTGDASVEGKLTVHTQNFATEGSLALRLPGLQSTVSGHLSDLAGEGTLQLTLGDAALATQWLAHVPGDPAHLAGLRLRGAGDLQAQWHGGWHKQGRALQLQAQLRTPRLDLFRDPKATEPALGLRDTQLALSGTLGAMDLQVDSKVHAANQQFAVLSRLQGGQEADGQWQGRIDSATVTAREAGSTETWTARLAQAVQVALKQDATRQTLAVSAGALGLTGPVPGAAELQWKAAQWSSVVSGKAVHTAWSTGGTLRDLPVGWLERIGKTQLANLGLRGDLVLGGQWEASSAQDLNLRVVLERTAGDLRLLGHDAQTASLSAGLRDTRLVLTAHNESLGATLIWDSLRAGQLNATASTRLPIKDGRWIWDPNAALTGKISASLPPVGVWSLLAPPGWRLSGSVESDAVLSGTLGTPLWRGNLKARDMAVRSVVDGIDFSHGTLNAQLDGQRLAIQEFSILGAGGAQAGQLVLNGAVEWLPALPASQPPANALSRLRMELDASLSSLRVSARADRRLALSGKLTARLANAQLLMRGDLKADEALIILPDDTAPQLGSDVVVRGRTNTDPATPATAATAKPITPDLAITLDLGPSFYVKGRGLSTRLAGQLVLTSSTATRGQPRLNGTVSTVRGTYLAYGQRLDIEEGELRFTGPFDNPALNVLALRSKLTQRVGVQINGTALAPVVRLYAEPDLPEAEKLAWLVLGRSPAGGGAETALLQQAALALMGSKNKGASPSLAQRVGLDELSVGGGNNTGQADNTGAGGATLTVGKRLSQDFYVAYETGLAGAVGTLQVFYDLSRRFSLRASTGTQSAVDLVFTHRYD